MVVDDATSHAGTHVHVHTSERVCTFKIILCLCSYSLQLTITVRCRDRHIQSREYGSQNMEPYSPRLKLPKRLVHTRNLDLQTTSQGITAETCTCGGAGREVPRRHWTQTPESSKSSNTLSLCLIFSPCLVFGVYDNVLKVYIQIWCRRRCGSKGTVRHRLTKKQRRYAYQMTETRKVPKKPIASFKEKRPCRIRGYLDSGRVETGGLGFPQERHKDGRWDGGTQSPSA